MKLCSKNIHNDFLIYVCTKNAVHRGAFFRFFSSGSITAISSKSNGKETGKKHLCAVITPNELCSTYRLFFFRSIAQFFTQVYMSCFVSL